MFWRATTASGPEDGSGPRMDLGDSLSLLSPRSLISPRASAEVQTNYVGRSTSFASRQMRCAGGSIPQNECDMNLSAESCLVSAGWVGRAVTDQYRLWLLLLIIGLASAIVGNLVDLSNQVQDQSPCTIQIIVSGAVRSTDAYSELPYRACIREVWLLSAAAGFESAPG